MSNKTKPLILVDGSSYLYRAFHALPALTNSKGQPTGAVYGIVNMLKRLMNDFQPEEMAVIFDAKGKTFRDELYSEYKANRQAMPDELAQQVAPIHELIAALGLPIIMIPGVEADDVIGTLAMQAAKQHRPVLISTGDKDLAQLVNEHISLINTMTNVTLDPAKVEEKFGVPPALIIDYLTLIGDTSDNIPGVPMVGPKTAAKWLHTYGNLDALILHADEIKGKAGDNFRAFIPQIALSKELVTIKLDVPLHLTHDDLALRSQDKKALLELYRQMEFKSWLNEILQDVKETTPMREVNYEIIYTEEVLDRWIKKLEKLDHFVFDTETTALNYMTAKIVGVSFAFEPHIAAYIPFAHDYAGAPQQLDKQFVLNKLKPLLENPNIQKIGQNLKYDMQVLANEGIALANIANDTMLESYLLDSASNAHDMDSLALKYLGVRTVSYTDIAGKGAKQLTFNQIPIEQAGPYAAEDADITLQLHHTLHPRIEKEAGLHFIYRNIEMPLVPVLARMEQLGVLIDPEQLRKQGEELQKRLLALEDEAFTHAGKRFNINSPKQLQEILFDVLKLPILQKTPTGQPSTADPVLQELALDFAMPRIVIEYRSLSKLISTYTSRLVEQIDPTSGRVHTSYNQTGTATGRLSSSDPNLQNIPIRTVEGKRIRQAFIAPAGYQIISADYSQIELRLMAHISQDESLLSAFANNLDIHQATAAEVWGVPLDQVTSSMRRDAKAINFGLIYGMSAFGLTRQLGIDRKSAQDYIDRYFARYPKVKAYMENTRLHAKEKGFVETLWGRRLYLPDINSRQIMRQKAAERVAINAPLQGSAADIIKMAMIKIDDWIRQEKIAARMIMQVHDELVFEAKTEVAEGLAQRIQSLMQHVVDLSVPLTVSVGIGLNWDAASAH